MIDINTLWNDTKIKLSARLQAISYEVWIEKLEPICFIGHTLVLQTGSQSSKNTIVKKLPRNNPRSGKRSQPYYLGR